MSIDVNRNLVKPILKPALVKATGSVPAGNTEIIPVVFTNEATDPEQMMKLLATQSATNGVTINTDKQNKAKLENAKTALAQAREALEQNTDPAKREELQKAVDKALENYQKVLKELADAGYLETKTTVQELPATRAEGTVRTETDEVYENGKIVLKTVKEYDSNGKVTKTIVTSYVYDSEDGALLDEYEETYNAEALLIQYRCSYYAFDPVKPHWINDYKYSYDDSGSRISIYHEEYILQDDGSYALYEISEDGYDKEGNKLIGKNGQPIDRRVTYPRFKGEVLTGSGFVIAYVDGKALTVIPAYEEQVGDVIRYYDKNYNIIAEQFSDDYKETPDTVIFYIRDEAGRVVKEEAYLFTERFEGEVLEKRSSTYTYNADGSYTRELVITNFADNTKMTYVEAYNADGEITKKTIITYDENGNVVSKKTIEGSNLKATPIDPLLEAEDVDISDEDVDISDQDATKLLSGRSSSYRLSRWVRSGAKNPRRAIAEAISSMMTEIGFFAGQLKAMGYDSAKVDSAATTLKNYYSALLNTVYDDDNRLQKKGETCETNFTYKDANGKVQSGSSNFRHYAFALEKNANKKVGAGSESASGIVLLENTGINHSYQIAVDMKTVVNKLIEFFNAL